MIFQPDSTTVKGLAQTEEVTQETGMLSQTMKGHISDDIHPVACHISWMVCNPTKDITMPPELLCCCLRIALVSQAEPFISLQALPTTTNIRTCFQKSLGPRLTAMPRGILEETICLVLKGSWLKILKVYFWTCGMWLSFTSPGYVPSINTDSVHPWCFLSLEYTSMGTDIRTYIRTYISA